MKVVISQLIFLCCCSLIGCDNSKSGSNSKVVDPNYYPETIEGTWPQVTSPESVGWSSEKLFEAYRYGQSIDTAAVIIIYRGRVLYHWGEIYRKFNTHSIRKSFMSAIYGVGVSQGEINIHDTLLDLGIDDSPDNLSTTEKAATIQMLMQSRSGIYIPAACEVPNRNRPQRYSHPPGTFWYYNNWDFNVLKTILFQKTGRDFYVALRDLIAQPIGMEDYQITDGSYEFASSTIHPCYQFNMSARDLARFGQLFLQKGVWEGQQIIPSDWVEESTQAYSNAFIQGGFGYMWWVAVDGKHFPGVVLPAGSYSAQGFRGHFLLVIPELDLVIVHRVNTFRDGQAVTLFEFGQLVATILDAENN